ncbi:MAG: amino acid ABC transporter ATP-binding protein, partial [Clostridia bacterium]|nr:amino acid ABC transporter ATP-binding protein [Clostridia bacterium]
MSVLEMKDIQKSFDGLEVVKGISLNVDEGEVVAIIGPSGSGKSTLLRCATMLERINSGEIKFGDKTLASTDKRGKAVYASAEEQREICSLFGLVFQNFNLFPHFSVRRNITEAPIHVAGWSREDADKKADELLEKMGLSDKADAYPCQLSGGQQQRVSIARA